MDVGRIAERVMTMDDKAWARHANPWSGWSRVAILPLLALALWSRVWIGWWCLVPVAGVALWAWINPRAFPAPTRLDSWMSRGVLGERLWLARAARPIPPGHARAARLLNSAAALGALPLAVGLWQLDPGLTLAGLILAMGAKLWFLDRMAWLKADAEAGRF
jgi:hypothetical protein